jgi:glycosyltransferase involved in cell wall biosynthesis
MKIYILHKTGKISYPEYIGIMTLRRIYSEMEIVSYGKGVNKYLDSLLKLPGISLIYHNNPKDHDLGDDFIVINPQSITLGEFIHLREPSSSEVDLDGTYLFDGEEFPSKDLKFIEYKIPEGLVIDEKFVSTSESNYAKLVRKILPERVWNPLNEPIWGVQMGNNLPLRLRDKKFRFHLLGLAHLPTSEEYMSCAFTQKNVKMCKMLMDLGHEVFLYGSEGSSAPCTKLIETHSLKDIRQAWGEGDNRFEIGYNWHEKQFKHDINEKKTDTTKKYYLKAIEEINKIKKDDDFLLITQGSYQKPIDDGVKLHLTVEPGIGYRGSYAKFRSFESSYIQYFTYGSEHPRQSINGAYYDRVIPNYFDEKDFPFYAKKDDYFLFMGRLIIRKGLDTAIKACKALGKKLIVAGQISDETKYTLFNDPIVEYVGYADAAKRSKLMGKAKAVFTPSTYLEPFCGVHAEAMLCGTPVLTTNFGAFTDYVVDGLNGYKCNTLQDFVDGARLIDKLDPKIVRASAKQFTLDSVKLEYQRWFQDLYRLLESSQDPSKKAWHHLE